LPLDLDHGALFLSYIRTQHITRVRLNNVDPCLPSVLADELLALGSTPTTATAWVVRDVLPFASVNSNTLDLISTIVVGDEVPKSRSWCSSLCALRASGGSTSGWVAAAQCKRATTTIVLNQLCLLQIVARVDGL
jgi:hypothetical protein